MLGPVPEKNVFDAIGQESLLSLLKDSPIYFCLAQVVLEYYALLKEKGREMFSKIISPTRANSCSPP